MIICHVKGRFIKVTLLPTHSFDHKAEFQVLYLFSSHLHVSLSALVAAGVDVVWRIAK